MRKLLSDMAAALEFGFNYEFPGNQTIEVNAKEARRLLQRYEALRKAEKELGR